MRKLRYLFFVVVAVSAAVAADEPTKPPMDLIPLTHSPDLFPVLPWDVVHDPSNPLRSAKNGLESVAECNFTVAGFVRPEDLPLCKRLGLAAILVTDQDWTKLPDEKIDGRVRQMVEATANNRTVLGYFIMVVNLSPENSTNITLETVASYKAKQVLSSENARLLPLDEKNGHWLVPGNGGLDSTGAMSEPERSQES